MSVRLAGDYKRPATVGFWSRLVAALGLGSARPGPEGYTYRASRDALRRITSGRYLR